MRLPMTPDEEHIDEEKAIPVIQRAYELDITYFDTAPYYCKSESEIVLGKAIKPWRDKITLSTKCPIDDRRRRALRFVFSHPGVSCAISGMGTIQMVEENVATASREEPLSDKERAQIMAALDETRQLVAQRTRGRVLHPMRRM